MVRNIIYMSVGSKEFTREEVLEILKKSQTNNLKNNVTGCLIYQNGFFLQLLEGKEEDVNTTFERIHNDNRHERVSLLQSEVTNNRLFKNWSMHHGELSIEEMEHIVKMNTSEHNTNETESEVWDTFKSISTYLTKND